MILKKKEWIFFFELDLKFTAPFRTNLTPLGLQKLPVALVLFASPQILSEILQGGGIGDTLAGPADRHDCLPKVKDQIAAF